MTSSEGHFMYYKRFYFLCLKNKYIMYEVNYTSRKSHVSNYFYCRIRPGGRYMMLSTTTCQQ